MTCKILRPLLALVLAVGMLAAVASPGRAALSTAERNDAPVAVAAEQTTLAAVSAPVTVAAATPAAAVATPVAAVAAPVAAQPLKTVAPKSKPQRLAYTPRKGYPCH